MGVRIRAAVVAAVVAAGGAAPTALADRGPTSSARPTVVVAVADSGVNPYHKAFYRPGNTTHPCRWVTGFKDCSIPALELSVGKHKTVAAAFAADRAVWESVRPHQWYWIPRTNIIGAVCDAAVGGGPTDRALPAEGPTACIFDENGHGTGTASSVLSEAPDSLLLVHEGNAGANDMVSAPVKPDVQSHSWGTPGYVTPFPGQAARPLLGDRDPCPVGEAGPETLAFLAAGNEAPTPSLLDCARSKPEIQVVGGGYPGYFQANSWSVYDFASWFCRPTAAHDSTDGRVNHCGTSFAAPTAAGTAAAALLRLRQHDRYAGRSTPAMVSRTVPRDRFVEALRSAATYTPKAKYPVPCPDPTQPCFSVWRTGFAPLPPQAPHLFWGYGWLDGTVADIAVSCALRRACPAKPDAARTYNEHRQQARAAASLYALAPGGGDDAGSRRDAGETPKTAVRISPGSSYAGQLAPSSDWDDAYAFAAKEGQTVTVASTASPEPAGVAGCWSLLRADGRRMTPTSTANITSCQPGSAPTRLRLPQDGTYTVVYHSYVPQDYRFTVTLGG